MPWFLQFLMNRAEENKLTPSGTLLHTLVFCGEVGRGTRTQ